MLIFFFYLPYILIFIGCFLVLLECVNDGYNFIGWGIRCLLAAAGVAPIAFFCGLVRDYQNPQKPNPTRKVEMIIPQDARMNAEVLHSNNRILLEDL